MSTPEHVDAEHVEAVEQFAHLWLIDCDIYGETEQGKYLCTIHDEFTTNDAYCGAVVEAARRILTDATLIPAMLDALTRHGVLTQETDTQQAWGRPPAYAAARLVTPWREIDSDEALAILRERLTGETP